MLKKFISILLCFVMLFWSAPINISAAGLDAENSLDKLHTIEKLNKLSDGKLKLRENDGKLFISGKLSGQQTAGEKSATKFLGENKSLFGIDNTSEELKPVDVNKDELGNTFVKYAQYIKGIKVYGNLLNVHFNKYGIITSTSGKFEKNKSITTLGSKTITENDAIEIAQKQFIYNSLRKAPKAERLILTKDGKNYEVFKVNISFMEPTIGNYDVFVEVHSGKVIKIEDNIRYDEPVTGSGVDVQGNTKPLNLCLSDSLYVMDDQTKTATSGILTYDAEHTTSSGVIVNNTSNYFNDENFKASVSAHYYAGQVVDFYKNLFGRNSLDNNGMEIDSFTHYGENFDNAFWDGSEMVYGDGDGSTYTYLSGDLDIVGHEMTHAVISDTANLQYDNQSGALNESIADTFGVLIETYSKDNVAHGGTWSFNPADWVIGDDVYTPGIKGDALRSLANPALYKQPDNMKNFVYSSDDDAGDDGGVHTNSGITNKAAYLVASKIGMEKTARIYYRALTDYMDMYTDFDDAENCLMQAADDLYGEDCSEAKDINDAFYSVGIGQPPVKSNNAPVISGATDKTIKVGDSFDPKAGVTASDEEDGDLTSRLTVTGNVNDMAVGQYKITYSVTDNDGNTTTKTITISVVPKNVQVISVIGTSRYDTAVKLSQSQFDTADTVMIVNGEAMADGLGATPLAKFKNAPLLLTETKSLPDVTRNEIERLHAKNAIIVGGTGVVSNNVYSQLQAIGLTVTRIGGSDRYGTSLSVAKYIDQNCYDVSQVVVSNGCDEADAMSIAPAAGRDNMPIMLVGNNNIANATYDWLKSKNLKDAYIIGGTGVVSNNVLNQINSITSAGIKNNRLGGSDRFETNSMVIDRFYGTVLDKIYIAKGFELIDALAAGPVAAVNGSPVVITKNDLIASQETVLDKRYANTIIRTGGGISNTAVNSLVRCLDK